MPDELTIPGILLFLGSGLLTLFGAGGRWLWQRLFAEGTGYATRLVEGQLRMMAAIEKLPETIHELKKESARNAEAIEQIRASTEKQTEVLTAILQEKSS